MIPRFTHPDMAALWDDDNKFRIWLEIELLTAEAWAKLGRIPAEAPQRMRARARFDRARIDAIEKEVRHDMIAFLTCVGESLGDDARYLHMGLTSSDVVDTALSVRLKHAAHILRHDLEALRAALRHRIEEHRTTLCIGRSHGIHAEPTTFGLKLAGHYAAFTRAARRLAQAEEEISVAALSGAVGTFATVDPRVESHVAEKLGLRPETVSTQVIPRDRHAAFFATLGGIAASIDNLATEIRHLQRTEVGEAGEFFSGGQKGSSAMPHKRNPVLCENLTGCARLIRAAVAPALEDVTLWHERDISHSAVERVIAPDATTLTDFALRRLAEVVEGMTVDTARMMKNLHSLRGLIFSQHVLLALTAAGMPREEAYAKVQGHARTVWQDETAVFLPLLQADPVIARHLDAAALAALFDEDRAVERVNAIIDRALQDA